MRTSSKKSKGRRLQNFVRDELLKSFCSLEPDDIKSFINNAKRIIKNKKIRTYFSNNSKNYKNLKNTSINKMIKIINE